MKASDIIIRRTKKKNNLSSHRKTLVFADFFYEFSYFMVFLVYISFYHKYVLQFFTMSSKHQDDACMKFNNELRLLSWQTFRFFTETLDEANQLCFRSEKFWLLELFAEFRRSNSLKVLKKLIIH